jgi:dipeptidyl aminopeptidase/acylaminoacyl peptidase
MQKISLTHREHLLKLLTAINKGTLALKGGTKYWRGYKLNIIELVWGRNIQDGYLISVFIDGYRGENIGEINIDGNLSVAKLEPHDEDFYAGDVEEDKSYAVYKVGQPDKPHSIIYDNLADAEKEADKLNNPKIKIH